MLWQDIVIAASAVVGLAELVLIAFIAIDDRAMRKMAEESLVISRESLAAQKEYLDLRRRWYASREKKKADDRTTI